MNSIDVNWRDINEDSSIFEEKNKNRAILIQTDVSDVIIIVPYGWQPSTKEQLYWWADRNLNPYSMSPSYNGATKQQMLDQLNSLPNIKFVGNIRNVNLPI